MPAPLEGAALVYEFFRRSSRKLLLGEFWVFWDSLSEEEQYICIEDAILSGIIPREIYDSWLLPPKP